MSNFDTVKTISAIVESLRVGHYECEDSWYSCPKCESGCGNDSAGDECNCGADTTNIKVDNILNMLQLIKD